MKRARSAALVLACAIVAACSKHRPSAEGADAAATASAADAAPAQLSSEQGHALVRDACLSCHSEEMLVQQRLTRAQWSKTVTKMVSWGANLDAKDAEPLAAWLAAEYGPDAGPYEPAQISAAAAAAEIAPLPDGPYANGDPERGRAPYTEKCGACHGAEAQGRIGVRLADRPILHRAQDVAELVRRGRGKMPPMALPDAEIADILAFLRRLR